MRVINHRQITVFLFILLAAIILPTQIAKAAPEASQTPSAPADTKARVNFKSPLSVPDVKKIAREKGIALEMLEGDFPVGSFTISDFYTVKPEMDAKAMEEDYKNSRLAYLKDTLNREAELPAEQRAELAPKFAEMKVAVQRNDVGDIKIKKLLFPGMKKRFSRYCKIPSSRMSASLKINQIRQVNFRIPSCRH